MVENGIMGLAYEINNVICSIHRNLMGLPANIAEHKVTTLVDIGTSHNFASKALIDRL